MANEKNLIPQAHVLTVDEASRGGKASAKARKQKKELRELLEYYLSKPAVIDGQKVDRKHVMALKVVELATEGKASDKDLMKAFELIRDTIGEKPTDRVRVEAVEQAKFIELLEQLEGGE